MAGDVRFAAKRQIREFLASRRARITPDEVGLGTGSSSRRVPGSESE